ncbi:protein phosphatase 2C domain-containing protein [Chromatium okenii]|uniref:protein phosphatase 2C domain-containing protein n=1 Tax=Chromatium okenii TaxID=61644 RepID=UPI001559E110
MAVTPRQRAGRAHHRSGQPNQDAARRFQLAGQAQMLALADGHGSQELSQSMRSAVGGAGGATGVQASG